MNTEMVALTEFTFNEQSIRVVGTQLDPWFVGVDVATALGYKNPQEAVRKHVPDEDKGVSELLTPGGVQKVVVIDEAGLYYLIFKSKLQAAQKFTWWVTHEVLPSIRKNGYYISKEVRDRLIILDGKIAHVEKKFTVEQKRCVENKNPPTGYVRYPQLEVIAEELERLLCERERLTQGIKAAEHETEKG